jgi:hypothetical protein
MEPCLCGDPECLRCFPRSIEEDEDSTYDERKQQELDDQES